MINHTFQKVILGVTVKPFSQVPYNPTASWVCALTQSGSLERWVKMNPCDVCWSGHPFRCVGVVTLWGGMNWWYHDVGWSVHSVWLVGMTNLCGRLEWSGESEWSPHGVVLKWFGVGEVTLWCGLVWSPCYTGWSGNPVVRSRLLTIWCWLKWSSCGMGWSACSGRIVGVVTLWVTLKWLPCEVFGVVPPWDAWSSHSGRGITQVPFALHSPKYLSLQPHSLLWSSSTSCIL